MQNWNQWPLSAGAVTTPVPQPPVGYASAGVDPMALMQSYMQYYNQPAPSGYTPEQWAVTQQQGWAQWQQWQQQYQQWQAQYGDKYQETMKHLSAQNMNLANQVQMPSNVQHPPLPKEDVRPPLPPTTNTYQFGNMPPPHQNNLPLFPAKESTNKTLSQTNITNYPSNPPLPTTQPPLPPEISENRENISSEKRDSTAISESSSAKKLKTEDDELSEAEKTFDAQFKQWEEQFNKWKQQNANHPDKTQYKQYEAKWTSWREKLIERREQMRKKREQQKQAVAKAEAEKNKNISGDDKILNILSNSENQRLINNLLGIGKTLGLTGKQNMTAPLPPPPPPPPPPETTNSSSQHVSTIQGIQQASPQVGLIGSNLASPWTSQQWGSPYNPRMEAPGYSGVPPMSSISSVPFGTVTPQMISPNFAHPPPNFSQPPPNFSNNDPTQLQNVRVPVHMHEHPPFGPSNPSTTNVRFTHPNDRPTQNFDGQSNFRKAEQERFGRDNINPKERQDQFRSDTFGIRNDNHNERFRRCDRNYNEFGNVSKTFGSGDQFGPGNDRFGSGNCAGNDRFNEGNNRFGVMGNDRFLMGTERFGSGNDRLGPANDRLGPGNDRLVPMSDRFTNEHFGPESDQFKSGIDRFGIDKDRFGHGNDRFGSGNDKFGSENNRYGSASDRFEPGADRFGPRDRSGNNRFDSKDRFSGNDRFGSNSESFGSNDRFNRNNLDFLESKDPKDQRRDNFCPNSRNFNRNPQFSPSNDLPPELKKLMEKRKAAMDIFKPSFLDSDKTSSVVSLSESFKKIAGDSPFRSSFAFNQKNPPSRESANVSNSGFGNFQSQPSDVEQASAVSYRSRDYPFNTHDNESIGDFRGPSENLVKDTHNPTDYNEQILNEQSDIETRTYSNQSQSINVQSVQTGTIGPDASLQIGNIGNVKDITKPIPINEINSVIVKNDTISLENNSTDKDENTEENKLANDSNSQQQENKEDDADQTQNNTEKKEDSSNDHDSSVKKSESLPFMGENDPRPEDLNIEPPPELPNLGPISTDPIINPTFNVNRISNQNFDDKVLAGGQLNVHLDDTFSSRGIEFKSGVPFALRGPPVFGPRAPHMFSVGPVSNVFQSQVSADVQLNSQSINDEKFGSNAPNDVQFSPKRMNDEQYDIRDRNNEQNGAPKIPDSSTEHFEPPNPGDEQMQHFDRSFNDCPFGPRESNDGTFSSGGPIDRHAVRGPDLPFALRNPRPFASKENELHFGQRSLVDRLDSRGVPELPFGSRGSTDGSCGFRSSTDVPFGTRRPTNTHINIGRSNRFTPNRSNEVPFDQRLTFDNAGSLGFSGDRSLGFRRSNEGLLNSRGSSDIMLGPRGSNDSFIQHSPQENMLGPRGYNENRFDMRGSDDGHFGSSEFKDRPLAIRESTNDLSTAIFSRDASDGNSFRNRGDYMRRNPYARREANITKIAKYESPKPDEFNRSYSDRNIDVDTRKDNTRYGANDAWKQNKFGNVDRRSDINISDSQHNVDNNIPTAFDERSRLEKTANDPKIGLDFQSKYGTNSFMKRSMDGRSQMRIDQELRVQRQFNYNHGEVDKKHIEYTPVKVIDYAHMSRSSNVDCLSPVQSFDYGHGNLKPDVPEREQQPKTDFRNWVETEQNLKEYTEKMRNYENYTMNYDMRRSGHYNKRKESDWLPSDKQFTRERKENDDLKERVYNFEDQLFDRESSNDIKDRHQTDRRNNKERSQDICDSSRREINKDNNEDDDRSKGNLNRQENSNKNIVDTKLQDSSFPDTKKNVVESSPKTLELAKMPNYTMVDDLLCPPGRQSRPPKIAIILRGPPGSGKSFVAKLIKDKEVEQGGSAPRILSLDDYFLVEKEIETKDDNGKKVTIKEMVYEYEEAMEQSYITSLVKAFKKNITDGFFNFIILDCINEKISDYEEMWSFAKTKGFKVYVCEMEIDLQICLKKNIHNRTEDEISRIIDYFEPTPSYHQKLDVNSMLQEQAIEEVDMEDSQETQQEKTDVQNEDSQDSHEEIQDIIGVSKWEKMETEDKLDRLDGLAKKKTETKPQTIEDFLQVPDYYNMEDTSGKKRVRWADLEERKEQEKMRAVGFVVGHTNWDRMMDPTKGGSALTRTKFFSLS